MEKIVQLSEKDYEELYNSANLNDKEIEEKAIKLWKENGAVGMNISLNISNKYEHNYHINCKSKVWSFDKDERFSLSPEIKKNIEKFANEYFLKIAQSEYGKGINLVNKCNENIAINNKTIKILQLIAWIGWSLFIITFLVLILR